MKAALHALLAMTMCAACSPAGRPAAAREPATARVEATDAAATLAQPPTQAAPDPDANSSNRQPRTTAK